MAKDPRLERYNLAGYNKPKRTPKHPEKSHVVLAKSGDEVKLIRFGQQGVSGSPARKGESKADKARIDHQLHPINCDYDLYSKGADGKSTAPLTAKISQDDIIRANNGGYVGLVSNY